MIRFPISLYLYKWISSVQLWGQSAAKGIRTIRAGVAIVSYRIREKAEEEAAGIQLYGSVSDSYGVWKDMA